MHHYVKSKLFRATQKLRRIVNEEIDSSIRKTFFTKLQNFMGEFFWKLPGWIQDAVSDEEKAGTNFI
ncbi:hypothetical protein T02_12929 [Trichinella nativa]|uniref:Uncharacterized protein n=1 Tax=Trichinella nativa TaxID=6335 RepID=A0A0V1KZ92_9BILA|nr:hypothetical protein T02_15344 [Trichinella nativa]KRZ53877.1 hypothetical protein T02_12929 [Trichinella nativa]